MRGSTSIAAVVMLGLLGALSIGGCVILSATGLDNSHGLCTLAGTCIGALAAFIVPYQRGTKPNNDNGEPGGNPAPHV